MDKCPKCGAEKKRLGAFRCGTQVFTHSRSLICYDRQIAQLTEILENTQAKLDEVKSYTVDRDMDIANLTERLEAWRGLKGLMKTMLIWHDKKMLALNNWEIDIIQKLRDLGEVE